MKRGLVGLIVLVFKHVFTQYLVPGTGTDTDQPVALESVSPLLGCPVAVQTIMEEIAMYVLVGWRLHAVIMEHVMMEWQEMGSAVVH